jgi:hypothetical protein
MDTSTVLQFYLQTEFLKSQNFMSYAEKDDLKPYVTVYLNNPSNQGLKLTWPKSH